MLNEKLNYYQQQTEARQQHLQQQNNVAQPPQPVQQHTPPDPKAVEWLQKILGLEIKNIKT